MLGMFQEEQGDLCSWRRVRCREGGDGAGWAVPVGCGENLGLHLGEMRVLGGF